MSLALTIFTLTMLGPLQNVEEKPVRIEWKPVVGQTLEYSFKGGSWITVTDSVFLEAKGVVCSQVVAAKPGLRNLKSWFLSRSYSFSTAKSEHWIEAKLLKPPLDQTVDEFGNPIKEYGRYPLGILATANEGVDHCTFRYPQKLVYMGQSWGAKGRDQSTFAYTYVRKEKVAVYDCFKVEFESLAVFDDTKFKDAGAYWIDQSDGKVVKMLVNTRQQSIADGPGYRGRGGVGYLEVELMGVKMPKKLIQ